MATVRVTVRPRTTALASDRALTEGMTDEGEAAVDVVVPGTSRPAKLEAGVVSSMTRQRRPRRRSALLGSLGTRRTTLKHKHVATAT